MFQTSKPKEPEQDAIIVQSVSKHFRIPHEKKTKLFDHIAGAIKGGASSYEEFIALKDVSFTVKKVRPWASLARTAAERALC